jgi:PIN domain nuclease of toxin-antitoxin system
MMKKYLIDTHILLWLVAEPYKLSSKTKEILINIDNTILVSFVSFWEIAIKTSIGKLEFHTTIDELKLKTFEKNIQIIFPTIQATSKIQAMPFYKEQNIEHRDPV